MIGKTNSIVVKGGDTPTPATTDKYKGLRPSYWPKVRLPSEVEGIFTDLVLFVPLSFNPFKKEGKTFDVGIYATKTSTIHWGDGTSTVPTSHFVATSHTYTINVADYNEKAQGWFYLLSIDGTAVNFETLTSGIQVLEVSQSNSPTYQWTDVYIQFYSNSDYYTDVSPVNPRVCQSLKLLPEFTLSNSVTSLDFSEAELYAFPDLNKDITSAIMPAVYYGTEWNPNFFNHITGSITFNDFTAYLNVSYLPQNITTNTLGSKWTGLEMVTDLSSYTYQDNSWNYWKSPFAENIVKSPSVIIPQERTGHSLFTDRTFLAEATVDPTNADDSDSSYLNNAFWGCVNLVYLHMPENSVKRQINLSDIATVYTDAEPRDNTMTVSQYAWTEIAKALHNYSGETAPSYTPTITISSTIKTFLDTLTIDGVNAKEYITNKGWTIA